MNSALQQSYCLKHEKRLGALTWWWKQQERGVAPNTEAILAVALLSALQSSTGPLTVGRIRCGLDNGPAKPVVISEKLPFWDLLDLRSVQRQQMASAEESGSCTGEQANSLCSAVILHLFTHSSPTLTQQILTEHWKRRGRPCLVTSPSAFM